MTLGAKDLDPRAAIPESCPVKRPTSYAVTAHCSDIAMHLSSAAASTSSVGSASPASLAGPGMRLRLIKKPYSCSCSSSAGCQASDMAQSTFSQQISQRAGYQSGCRSTAGLLAQSGASEQQQMQQPSHTPLHGFSVAFRLEDALTQAVQGAGSPMPHRAVSELAHQASAVHRNAGMPQAASDHQGGCEAHTGSLWGQGLAQPNGQGRRQPEEQEHNGLKAEMEGEQDKTEPAEGTVLVEGEWCEAAASPRWWDSVAKTDLIGIRELQRSATLEPRLTCCKVSSCHIYIAFLPSLSSNVRSMPAVSWFGVVEFKTS